MFSSNALPLPSPSMFAHEHHPLRLTSDVARLQPQGPCHFILLHPTQQNQRCSCQSYHHNRSAAGNTCDCGHQSCFHLTTSPAQEKARSLEPCSHVTERALLERIERLEVLLQREREAREVDLARQRQSWEREVRILREALAPFYKSEQDMRRKLVELEDRVEGNYDEQLCLKDRIFALDDAHMQMEKRFEELEDRGKRRRISRQTGGTDPIVNGQGDGRHISQNIDDRSRQSSSSRALSPNGTRGHNHDHTEPRSSGILNLTDAPRAALYPPPPPPPPPPAPLLRGMPSHSEREEPRSSGFLALDLAERLGNKKIDSERCIAANGRRAPGLVPSHESSPDHVHSDPDQPTTRRSPSFPLSPSTIKAISQIGTKLSPLAVSPQKRKNMIEHRALDVLADVSVASPLIP